MKIFTGTVFLLIFLLKVFSVSAQTPNDSVWAVDFIKTRDGRQADYLKFAELNWAKARRFMKDKGIVASYQALSVPAEKAMDWDVLLITEYVNRTGFDKREEVFQAFRKDNPVVLINGMTGKQLGEVKFSLEFNRPITSEAGGIMLTTQNLNPEVAAARIPLENYLKGHATGDPELMKKAFYSDANLVFIRDGKYSTRTFKEYIGGIRAGKPAPDEAQRKRWIDSLDITGNAGIAKIILDYPDIKFVDYMTLLKIDGEWKIVTKSFYAEPKKIK